MEPTSQEGEDRPKCVSVSASRLVGHRASHQLQVSTQQQVAAAQASNTAHACCCCCTLAVQLLSSSLTEQLLPCRPGTTSEDVDAKGVANIAKAWAARQDGSQKSVRRREMVTMRTSKDLDRWDVVRQSLLHIPGQQPQVSLLKAAQLCNMGCPAVQAEARTRAVSWRREYMGSGIKCTPKLSMWSAGGIVWTM